MVVNGRKKARRFCPGSHLIAVDYNWFLCSYNACINIPYEQERKAGILFVKITNYDLVLAKSTDDHLCILAEKWRNCSSLSKKTNVFFVFFGKKHCQKQTTTLRWGNTTWRVFDSLIKIVQCPNRSRRIVQNEVSPRFVCNQLRKGLHLSHTSTRPWL